MSAPQKCYSNSVSVLRRCCGAVRPACVGVEQQRQHIRVSTKAPALQCSAGRPASSANSFFLFIAAAAAVLVAFGRPPAHFFDHRQQQQEQQHLCLRLWQRWRHLLDAGGAGDCSVVVLIEQSCWRCLCLLCPSVQLAHSPPLRRSGLWCSLGIVHLLLMWVSLWLLLCAWPL